MVHRQGRVKHTANYAVLVIKGILLYWYMMSFTFGVKFILQAMHFLFYFL